MRLAYYQPQFPFPQGASAGPYRKFPGMGFYGAQFPFPQGAAAGPYPRFLKSPGNNGMLQGLGTYRPNQGFYRGVTPGVSKTLGQGITDPTSIDLTDPTTLLEIAGGVFVLWYLFKGVRSAKHSLASSGRRRRAKRALQAQLSAM